ncbi:hypothetical protein KIN20_020403 [Parelaphostrongylus tenuis]|uniref:Uncharacterized protein n=1 Tax=Parelaphostrongylus tenuis TaxID=148309 RepID=A0AAD5N369_PARTN|nr:hypothetical protein KIN20_020403 [Parelaphostrongylus tenuis]
MRLYYMGQLSHDMPAAELVICEDAYKPKSIGGIDESTAQFGLREEPNCLRQYQNVDERGFTFKTMIYAGAGTFPRPTERLRDCAAMNLTNSLLNDGKRSFPHNFYTNVPLTEALFEIHSFDRNL